MTKVSYVLLCLLGRDPDHFRWRHFGRCSSPAAGRLDVRHILLRLALFIVTVTASSAFLALPYLDVR